MNREKQTPARDRQSTGDQIIDAAQRVFSEFGYAEATTRKIANEAGVNEVTIFRHFGTKEGLLKEIIKRKSAMDFLHSGTELALTGNLESDLTRIGLQYLSMTKENMKSIIVTIADAFRRPEIMRILSAAPLEQRKVLSDYLEKQIEAGVCRPLENPVIIAQAFFGMFFEYVLSGMVYREQDLPDAEAVRLFVDIFVRGLGAKR